MTASKKEKTLGKGAHDLAQRVNEEKDTHQKDLETRDRQKRTALLRRKSAIRMADDLYNHFNLLVLESALRGGFYVTGYTLPITKTTKTAVALVEARLATEDVKLTWTEGPYESGLGTTNCDFLHLTLNW